MPQVIKPCILNRLYLSPLTFMKNICKPFIKAQPWSISQPFGVNPQSYQPNGHVGVDFGYYHGTGLVAPRNVRIVKLVEDLKWQDPKSEELEMRRGFGVVMQDLEDQNLYYLYWHCTNTFPVEVGDIVQQGELVALMSNTGYVMSAGQYVPLGNRNTPPYMGTHLHFEMYTLSDGKKNYLDSAKFVNWDIVPKYSDNILDKISLMLKKMIKIINSK